MAPKQELCREQLSAAMSKGRTHLKANLEKVEDEDRSIRSRANDPSSVVILVILSGFKGRLTSPV